MGKPANQAYSASERRRLMRAHLAQFGELDVLEACKHWNASAATVRRDFMELERLGLARREWGRLRASESLTPSAPSMEPFPDREIQNAEAKKRIAKAATELLRPGDVVMVDGGTTTLQLAPFLANLPIKIITNSIAIAHAMDQQGAGRSNVEVFLTGGRLFPNSYLLVGPQAKSSIRTYRADWTFLSAAGVDAEGVSNSNELVIEVEQLMIEHSERVALLADQTKFGRKAMSFLCGWSDLNCVITNASEKMLDAFVPNSRDRDIILAPS